MGSGGEVDMGEQIAPRGLQGLAKAQQDVERGVRRSRLDPLEVGAVDLGRLAKLLLGQSRAVAELGDILPELAMPVHSGKECGMTEKMWAAYMRLSS